MSDYESHTGKLILLEPKDGEDFKEQCKRLFLQNGGELEEYNDYSDLFSEFYNKYLYINEGIYQIIDHKELGEEDMFCKIHKNDDDTYSFHTRFYNGGTCLSEMLEDGMLDFKENEEEYEN